jgi:predicted  nucleic acid-binding Zn-ribbon protein
MWRIKKTEERTMEGEKRIGELKGEIQKIEDRLRRLPEEIGSVKGKIEEARKRLEAEKQETEGLRRQRQSSLTEGKGVGEISMRLNRIRENSEILEDTIVGFEGKLSQVETEEKEIRGKPEALREEITKLELVPLVQKYNELGEEMGKVLKDFFPKLWTLRGSERSLNSVVFPSTFAEKWTGALELVPRLCFGNQPKGENFFSFASLKEDHIRKNRLVQKSEE